MAKKLIDPETSGTEDKAVAADNTQTVEATQNKSSVEEKKPSTSVPKTKSATTEIPAYVHARLKAKSKYKSLYVDSHGGTYTSDTPENIRGNAILYENPYHKPQ